MLLSGCGCSCNQAVAPLPPTNDTCRTLSTVKLGTLVYLQGLDVDLCERFQALSDAIGLRDCAGNRIDLATPIVTCADFKAQLCAALALLADGGEAVVESTQLVGADCKLYTLPASSVAETPNTVTDTASIDFTATGALGRNISGDVRLSDDAGQLIEIRPDGLYATFDPDPAVSACLQIQAFPFEGDAEPGTVLVGSDCRLYTFPATEPLTVIDTDTVDLTLSGLQLAAAVRLDPDTGNILTATPDGLILLCTDVLACAPPVTVTDTPTLNLSIFGQDIQGQVRISADADNNLEAHGDGLYVNVCGVLASGSGPVVAVPGSTQLVGVDCNKYTLPTSTALQVADTTTVNLSWDGVTLQADVNVQPGTLLTTGPQGLQVTCEAVQDCAFNISNNFWTYNDVANQVLFNPSSDSGNRIVNGSDGRPFVGAEPLTVQDTQCINLSLVGDVLSATPILNPLPSNALICDANGLFVPDQDFTVLGTDTQCIDTTVTEGPVGTFSVSSIPIVSPDVGNALECRPNGFFSGQTPLAVQDSDCIDLTISEPFPGNFLLEADIDISPDAGNVLECRPNGLFADTNVTITATDTDCIDLTITEPVPNTFLISADIDLDPSTCNGLSCGPSGLLSPPQNTGSLATVESANTFSGPMIAAQSFSGPTTTLVVTNPSSCREAQVVITLTMPQITVDNTGGVGTWRLRVVANWSITFPAVLVQPLGQLSQVVLTGGTGEQQATGVASIVRVFTVPAGFVGNFTEAIEIDCELAGINSVVVGPVRLNYSLTTI